jgi:hypothetical protein
MLANELEAAYANGEQLLAQRLPFEQPRAPLAHDQLERFGRFMEFAKERCCRAIPARPTTIAAFVVHEHGLGTPAQQILSLLEAIEAHHNHHGLANPNATAIVRLALDNVIHVEPPRSWPKEDKVRFGMLPPDTRDIIARRERDREIGLRRGQNEIAELRKRLKTEAATNSVNVNEKKELSNYEHSQA